MYAMFYQAIIMLMGIFGQAFLGPCKRAPHTVLAAGHQWVAKSNEVLATKCTQNYVCNELAETWCCCAEQI
jgi:hypothetical protein